MILTSPIYSTPLLLPRIKEERCSLELDHCPLVRHIFTAKDTRFSLYLGLETRAAALGFFQHDMLEVRSWATTELSTIFIFGFTFPPAPAPAPVAR